MADTIVVSTNARETAWKLNTWYLESFTEPGYSIDFDYHADYRLDLSDEGLNETIEITAHGHDFFGRPYERHTLPTHAGWLYFHRAPNGWRIVSEPHGWHIEAIEKILGWLTDEEYSEVDAAAESSRQPVLLSATAGRVLEYYQPFIDNKRVPANRDALTKLDMQEATLQRYKKLLRDRGFLPHSTRSRRAAIKAPN